MHPLLRSNTLIGHYDGYRDGVLRGWLTQTISPKPLDFLISIDGSLTQKVRADRFREDLQAANLGENGRCGFSVATNLMPRQDGPRIVLFVKAHPLLVLRTQVLFSDMNGRLVWTPLSLVESVRIRFAARRIASSRPVSSPIITARSQDVQVIQQAPSVRIRPRSLSGLPWFRGRPQAETLQAEIARIAASKGAPLLVAGLQGKALHDEADDMLFPHRRPHRWALQPIGGQPGARHGA